MAITTTPPRSTRLPLLLLLLPFSLLLFLASLPQVASKNSPSSYIVYLGGHAHGSGGVSTEEAQRKAAEQSHYDLLGSVLGGDGERARRAIFYSYTKNINGFAADLAPEEAAAVAQLPGVVSVFPNRGRTLHTTRSWEFMGLERGGVVPPFSAWEIARYGENAIIGNLDSGVWPESKSFDDGELGPIPYGWKGICQNEHDARFRCNSKLIGARYFNRGYASASGGVPLDVTVKTPRDDNGHGTHTLSTAGGAAVRGASAFGFGEGTARGGSPRARVAAYRVCFPPVKGSECFDADILAGFEAAIADGVHVITASVGSEPGDYLEDAVAIGSLHAVKAGITVVCSASNFGPEAGTVSNVAPWILTVAASTVDRSFTGHVIFNHTRAEGQSLSETWLRGKYFYPMISAGDAAAPGSSPENAEVCAIGSLDAAKVKGKLVVCKRGGCPRVDKGEAVRRAGGAGMILVNDETAGYSLTADPHVLPAININYVDGLKLFDYLKSAKDPYGFMTRARTVVGMPPAPVMAAFSSRGPNSVNPEILKPDVTAPGVSVIAAWSGEASPTERPYDQRRVPFNTMSGTSMSCPHVAGLAGLVRTLHPGWSPAAIKSAIMTSAAELDMERKPIMNASLAAATPFSYGAGHIFPRRALGPGLVYDMGAADYLDLLCALGYNATTMELFNEAPYRCPAQPFRILDLNYPSITVPDLPANPAAPATTVRRRVKNVGPPATYEATIVRQPEGVEVTVTPSRLVFLSVGEEREFQVSFAVRNATAAADYAFGALVWSDPTGDHRVRSTIVVKTLRA